VAVSERDTRLRVSRSEVTVVVDVQLARPGTVTSAANGVVTHVDGVEAHDYGRLVRELEEAGGMTVSLTERLTVPGPPAILCTRYDFDLEDHPDSSYGRTVLMDAPGNAIVLVAGLRLLGAVMEREFLAWRSGGPVRLDRAVMARRDIAESMNAVGDSIYTLDEYCYLRRDDWISLPQVLNHYLRHGSS
jgi:hypothetical protein